MYEGPVIQIENLTKTYRMGKVEVNALRGASLTVERGEFVAVMGPSGSGKSTFLNLLGCLDRPTSGTYVLDGTDVSSLNDDQRAAIRSRTIGFVFQGFNLLSRTTALQNVELPLIYSGYRDHHRVGHTLLEAVGLPDRAAHKPNEMSGGEQQRVAIARSLVNSPSLILADEPTGNLDSRMSDEVMEIFRSLNRAGITIVLITHEENVAEYARRLVRFKDGRILSDEPVTKSPPAVADGIDVDKIRMDGLKAEGKRRGILSPGELLENVRSAARSLWQNRMRAVLTTLGILIGVAAVIAMVSVGQGSSAQVTQRIEGLGSNLLTIIPGSPRVAGQPREGFGSATTLTLDDADAIKGAIPAVTGVAPEMSSRVNLKYLRNTWSTNVVGTLADYPMVRNWPVESGAFFSEDDNRYKRAVCVIGRDIVTNLFEDADPLGKTIKIQNSSFSVIGVLQARGGGGFMSQDDTVIMPITTAMARFTGNKVIRSMSVSVAAKEDMAPAKEELTALLRLRHKLADAAADDFQITSQEDILNTVQGVTQTLTLLLASIAGISLLVGGIGIMNIMLVSVTERTREIGIRKAIGARRRDVLAQFLTEAVILSGTGGLLGWALGSVIAKLVSRFGNMPVVISPETILLAVGFSVVVGVFFGIYPARKASRMDPIQALHFE